MRIKFDWWIGTYNFCDSKERSFYGKVFIVDDEWKSILQWANYPVIEYSIKEEDSRHWLDDEKDEFISLRDSFDIQELFDRSYKYISGMWSTKDYIGNLLMFERILTENYEDIRKNFITDRNTEIKREIAQLESRILTDSEYSEAPELGGKEKEIKKIQKSIEYYEKQKSEYREWSDWYLKADESIVKYTSNLNALISHTPVV